MKERITGGESPHDGAGGAAHFGLQELGGGAGEYLCEEETADAGHLDVAANKAQLAEVET